MTHKEKAQQLLHQQYHCSQALFGAFADQPVDWYPWGDTAFEKAARENKPVFLSIGYSTCHWCHVMARESFFRQTEYGRFTADFRI